jgi:hypothetical protein
MGQIRAEIESRGDSSVGIDGYYTEVDLKIDPADWSDEDRAYYRSELEILFGDLWGEKVNVSFVEAPYC